MPRLRPAILLFAALAACGTPQERCIRGATGDLRTLDRLIAVSEQNLARGFALEETTVFRTQWVPCAGYGYGTVRGPNTRPGGMCLEDRPQTVTKPKAIDLEQEKRTLAQMKVKRGDLARAAGPAIAQCRASHPE